MPSRLGPRFAIEAIFLVLVAVGVAFADLSAQWIVIVMAAAWLLTAVVEWLAARPPRVAQPVAAAASWPEAEVYAVAAPPQGEVVEVDETGGASWPSEAFPLPVVEEAEPSAPVEPEPMPQADAPEPEPSVAEGEAEAPDAEVELEPALPVAEAVAAQEPEPDVVEQEPLVAEPQPVPEEPAEPKRRFWRRQREAAAVEDEESAPEPVESHLGEAAAVAAAASVVDEIVSDAPEEAAAEGEPAVAGTEETETSEQPKRRLWRRRAGEAALAATAASLATSERDDAEPDEEPAIAEKPAAIVAPEAPAAEPEVQEEPVDEPVRGVDAAAVAVEPALQEADEHVEREAEEQVEPEAEAEVEPRAEEEPAQRGRFWRRKAEPEAEEPDPAAELEAVVPMPIGDDEVPDEPVELEPAESVDEVPQAEARRRFWRRKSDAEPDAEVADGAGSDIDAVPELAGAVAATEPEDEPSFDEEEVPDDEPAFVNGDASGALGEVKRSEPVGFVPAPEPARDPEPEVPEEAAEEPEPAPQQELAVTAPRLMRRLPQPREWTIWELERAIGEHAGDDPQRDRQWRMTLFDLRRHADRRGAIPVDLDPVVRETFSDLIEPAGGS